MFPQRYGYRCALRRISGVSGGIPEGFRGRVNAPTMKTPVRSGSLIPCVSGAGLSRRQTGLASVFSRCLRLPPCPGQFDQQGGNTGDRTACQQPVLTSDPGLFQAFPAFQQIKGPFSVVPNVQRALALGTSCRNALKDADIIRNHSKLRADGRMRARSVLVRTGNSCAWSA